MSIISIFRIFPGLVKDLDHHKYDYATKFLNTHNTYILLEKQLVATHDLDVDMSTDTDGTTTPAPPQYNYVPLLDNCTDHFPNFKLHVAQTEKKKKSRSQSKSPSPAGMRPTRTAKNKPTLNRTPSKRR